jgi:hypothetical protein
MTSTNVGAMQKQQAKAALQNPVVQAQAHAGGAHHPNLDAGPGKAHPDNATAVTHLHGQLGVSAANTGGAGATANHRVSDLKATLGGGAAHGANQRAETALATLGDVTHDAINRGAGVAFVPGLVHAAGEIMPSVNERLERVLARLKAGLAHNIGAGVAIEGIVTTKTNGTPAGAITHGAAGRDAERAAAAADIEDFLAEIGW